MIQDFDENLNEGILSANFTGSTESGRFSMKVSEEKKMIMKRNKSTSYYPSTNVKNVTNT